MEDGNPFSWWEYEYNDQGNVVRETDENRDGIIGIVMYAYAYLDQGGCPRQSTDLEGSGSEP